ncbi:MAG: radical SAM family heme chaperone HemW [Desulfovibrionaceae bacterium]|nr:radical SAM family heme chaperone HemW [Desulfovibrionaceae bacterium]
MLLYIHVPYCRSKCLYCSFYSRPFAGHSVPDEYRVTLLEELRWWGRHQDLLFPARNVPAEEASDQKRPAAVTSVFFGGGTPSLLSAEDVGAILDAAAGCFSLAADAEVSLEGNPESLTPRKIRDLAHAGVNRLSMGVQSMHEEDLRMLGRIHTAAQVRTACEAAHAAGIRSFNLDLMWALPGQTTAAWLDNLRQVCELAPDHLSCYALTIEEGTPLSGMLLPDRQGGLPPLPEEDECERMYLEGAAFLESRGIRQYEISNYARDGHRCRHNLGYWHGLDYLGLGPSAVSTIGCRRLTSQPDTALWQRLVAAGAMPGTAEPLSARDRLYETVMLRLRMTDGLPLALYERMAGRGFAEDHAALLPALIENGLMTIDSERVALTRMGLLVSNDIVARLFEDMDEREAG